jgi:hypothetical protein
MSNHGTISLIKSKTSKANRQVRKERQDETSLPVEFAVILSEVLFHSLAAALQRSICHNHGALDN